MKYKSLSSFSSVEKNIKEKLNTSYRFLYEQGGQILGTRKGGCSGLCSDNAGGAYIIIEEGNFLYAQKINSSGDLQWNESGVLISQPGGLTLPKICKDNNGNAIITWTHYISTYEKDIFVQKVNASGDKQWGINPVPICTFSGSQFTNGICTDGSGGAIIVWIDYRGYPDPTNAPADVYVQRVNSTGDIQWTYDGVLISDTNDEMHGISKRPFIISDGAGGAIIGWEDQNKIYTQKINASGHTQWISNGMPICDIGSQHHLTMCSDGLGGAYFSWMGGVGVDNDIYAQRVNSTGGIQWTIYGKPIIIKGDDQWFVQICNDGSGNAILTWMDDIYTSDTGIYAQKIDSDGNLIWNQNGVKLGDYIGVPIPQICADGVGGAFIAWKYETQSHPILCIQHIDSMGFINWYNGGIFDENPCTLDPKLCSNEKGGCILSWSGDTDYRRAYVQIILNIDNKPVCDHPDDIVIPRSSSEFISWSLQDDFGRGQYHVIVSDSQGNITEVVEWTVWMNNIPLKVPINCTSPGIFSYTIEYYDNQSQLGIPDTVMVTIMDLIPTSNHPENINTSRTGSERIAWILTDDWGGGQYRVKVNNTQGGYFIWQNWTLWTNNTSLNVPINRTDVGIFNYTIEYYDDHGQYGIPDCVIVYITPPTEIDDGDGDDDSSDNGNGSRIIAGYNTVLLLGTLCTITVILLRKPKRN